MQMSNDEIQAGLKQLQAEVKWLRQIVHLQKGFIDGLRIYTECKFARGDPALQDTEQEFSEFMIRRAYDDLISHIEDSSPALAAELDMRPGWSPEIREKWYFPPGPK
jgi:hypothetical protein